MSAPFIVSLDPSFRLLRNASDNETPYWFALTIAPCGNEPVGVNAAVPPFLIGVEGEWPHS